MKNADGMYVNLESHALLGRGLIKTRYRFVEVWLGVFFPLRHIYRPEYAERQIERLAKLESLDGLKHDEEAKELGRAYEMLWAANADEQDEKLQILAFRLVLCAYIPLTPQQLVEALRFDPDKPENYESGIDLPQVEGLYHNFLRTDSDGFLDFEHISAKVFVLNVKSDDNHRQIFSDFDNHRVMADISLQLIERPEHQLWQCAGIQLRQWQSHLSNPHHFRELKGIVSHSSCFDGKFINALSSFGLQKLGRAVRVDNHFVQYLMFHWTRHCYRTCLEDMNFTRRLVDVLQNSASGIQGWSLALGALTRVYAPYGFAKGVSLELAFRAAYGALYEQNFGDKTTIEAHPLLSLVNFDISPCRNYEGRTESFLPVTADDMMIRNLNGDTVLHVASKRPTGHTIRDILMLEKSLENRPRIPLLTLRNFNGVLPLHYAINYNIEEGVKDMLEFEAQYAGLPPPP